jgi:hypothetical protein
MKAAKDERQTPGGGVMTTVREHREVMLAAAILAGVLLVIDTAAIGQLDLVLSLGPLAFLVYAALVKLTPSRLAAWAAALALLGVSRGKLEYAGLAYPVVALALARLLQARGVGKRAE